MVQLKNEEESKKVDGSKFEGIWDGRWRGKDRFVLLWRGDATGEDSNGQGDNQILFLTWIKIS